MKNYNHLQKTLKRCTLPASTRKMGFALMIVIVVLLLASFLASQLILQVKAELLVAQNVKARTVGNYLAEAGVNLGLFRVLGQKPIDVPDFGTEEEWEFFFEGFQYEFYLPLGRVTYYAVNESGKIDLNKSPQGLLEMFIEYTMGTADEEQIDILVDSLLDWRDSDDLHRLNGAESEYYQDLDDPYIARNGRIEDPSEFFLIRGTENLSGQFDAMDVFTVYNTGGKINFNSLTPAMLAFVTNKNSEAIAAYRDAKKEYNGKLTASIAAEILGEERFGELRPYLTFTSGRVQYFSISGTGQPGLEQNFAEEVDLQEEKKKKSAPGSENTIVIQKKGANYTVMSWQERYI